MSQLKIGVDLGGTNTRAGLVTEEGEIIGRHRCPTRLDLGSDGVVEGIVACAKEAAKAGGFQLSDVRGVGVGSPGPLDPFDGVIISPVNLPCMCDFRLRERMEEILKLPVAVDNDANVAALGEQWKGVGQGIDHFLCITLGTGVGGGWVVNGALMHGFNGNAAEVGHMSIDLNGPRCSCGNYGCLEMYVSAPAVVRRARARLAEGGVETSLDAEGLTTKVITEAAEAGDAFATTILEETGFFLGVGVVNLVSVMNVDVVVLAGGLALAGARILDPARRTLMERGATGVKESVRIVKAELGDDAGIMGAVRLLREKT